MTERMFSIRTVLLGSMMASAVVFAPRALAQVGGLLPNLNPLPAFDIALVGTQLFFSTTSWNSGLGPLELVPGQVDTGSGKQQVYQRVYLSDGTSFDDFAGWMQWHQPHFHFHFDGYALYTLQPVNAPGGSQRTGSKTTFCVMDTDKINGSLPGAPTNPFYSGCGTQIQGMSVGWGDTYGYWLAGQNVDFTGNPDGIYRLKIEVDPNNLLLETDENDNVSCVLLDIQGTSVMVLDSSGSCSAVQSIAVQSIAPNQAQMGRTVPVTITGFGFTQGISVSFENGNGARPVASNVFLAQDTDTTDTITATVTVQSKRKGGHDPVWNLRVGSAVLPNAFTVQ
jgi:Lysyl oxidase